jgi:tetratricopeptide (TPR) repeat protein
MKQNKLDDFSLLQIYFKMVGIRPTAEQNKAIKTQLQLEARTRRAYSAAAQTINEAKKAYEEGRWQDAESGMLKGLIVLNDIAEQYHQAHCPLTSIWAIYGLYEDGVVTLANSYLCHGQYEKAEPLYQQIILWRRTVRTGAEQLIPVSKAVQSEAVLQAFRNKLPHDPETVQDMIALGQVCDLQHRFVEAEQMYKAAFPYMDPYGDRPGVVHRNTRPFQRKEGEAICKTILEKAQATLGAENSQVATRCELLEHYYREKRNFSKAKQFVVKAVAIRQKLAEPDSKSLCNDVEALRRYMWMENVPALQRQGYGIAMPLCGTLPGKIAWCGVYYQFDMTLIFSLRRKSTPAVILAVMVLLPAIAAYAQHEARSGWIENEGAVLGPPPLDPVQTQTTGAHKGTLKGGVEHSEVLSPLPAYLKVGAIFDQALLAPHPDLHRWYRIPNWLAAEWGRDQETIVSAYYYDSHQRVTEPQTIAAKETTQFGLQVDRLGGIWHCRIAAGGLADCGSYYSVALVASQEPEEVSENMVVIRDVFTELHVNKETNVIILALQAESLTQFRPVRDGLLKTVMSVKFFEEDGGPKSVQRNLSYDTRRAPFAPLNSYKGYDLRSAFKQFLLSNGKENLLPDDRTSNQDDH